MIIDPQVGPYSPPDEIRTWIAELGRMLADVTDPGDRDSINSELQRARGWLEDAGK